MQDVSAQLTDDEIVHEIDKWSEGKRYTDPLRGLTENQIREIERRALEKIRRRLSGEAAIAIKAMLADAARERDRRVIAAMPSGTRTTVPVSELEPVDLAGEIKFPGRSAGTIQARGRGVPIRRTGPGKT